MAFVLFNVSDEIVSREKKQVLPIRKETIRSAYCLWETGPENFTEKIMEICQDDPVEAKRADGTGCFYRCGKLGKNTAGALVSHELAEKGIEYRYLLGGKLLIDMEEQPRRRIRFP